MPALAYSHPDDMPRLTPVPAPSPSVDGAVERARRGDIGAFEELYRHTSGRVYAICLRMTGDRERAKELLQDVYVRVWERLDSYRGDAAFTSWLYRLAVNAVLTQARSSRRRGARFDEMPDDPDAEELGDDGAEARLTTERMDLESAILALPPSARRVFVLHDIEGYRHDEIAQLTGNAPGTIRAHLHRARKLLMEALGK